MFERSTSFWNARDTGTAKTIANQANRVASQKQKYGAPKLENTARLWTLKGEQYLGNRTSIVKYAGAQVEIDPAIRADTLKLLEKIAPDLAEAFDRVLPPKSFIMRLPNLFAVLKSDEFFGVYHLCTLLN